MSSRFFQGRSKRESKRNLSDSNFTALPDEERLFFIILSAFSNEYSKELGRCGLGVIQYSPDGNGERLFNEAAIPGHFAYVVHRSNLYYVNKINKTCELVSSEKGKKNAAALFINSLKEMCAGRSEGVPLPDDKLNKIKGLTGHVSLPNTPEKAFQACMDACKANPEFIRGCLSDDKALDALFEAEVMPSLLLKGISEEKREDFRKRISGMMQSIRGAYLEKKEYRDEMDRQFATFKSSWLLQRMPLKQLFQDSEHNEFSLLDGVDFSASVNGHAYLRAYLFEKELIPDAERSLQNPAFHQWPMEDKLFFILLSSFCHNYSKESGIDATEVYRQCMGAIGQYDSANDLSQTKKNERCYSKLCTIIAEVIKSNNLNNPGSWGKLIDKFHGRLQTNRAFYAEGSKEERGRVDSLFAEFNLQILEAEFKNKGINRLADLSSATDKPRQGRAIQRMNLSDSLRGVEVAPLMDGARKLEEYKSREVAKLKGEDKLFFILVATFAKAFCDIYKDVEPEQVYRYCIHKCDFDSYKKELLAALRQDAKNASCFRCLLDGPINELMRSVKVRLNENGNPPEGYEEKKKLEGSIFQSLISVYESYTNELSEGYAKAANAADACFADFNLNSLRPFLQEKGVACLAELTSKDFASLRDLPMAPLLTGREDLNEAMEEAQKLGGGGGSSPQPRSPSPWVG